MTQILRYLGMASGLLGALLVLFGVIGFLIGDEFLGVRNYFNWFFIANTFIFLAIMFYVWRLNCLKHEEKGN